ncbi:hypothetical protein T484DRAFT_1773088, partial [Baffinella frigidus]
MAPRLRRVLLPLSVISLALGESGGRMVDAKLSVGGGLRFADLSPFATHQMSNLGPGEERYWRVRVDARSLESASATLLLISSFPPLPPSASPLLGAGAHAGGARGIGQRCGGWRVPLADLLRPAPPLPAAGDCSVLPGGLAGAGLALAVGKGLLPFSLSLSARAPGRDAAARIVRHMRQCPALLLVSPLPLAPDSPPHPPDAEALFLAAAAEAGRGCHATQEEEEEEEQTVQAAGTALSWFGDHLFLA